MTMLVELKTDSVQEYIEKKQTGKSTSEGRNDTNQKNMRSERNSTW